MTGIGTQTAATIFYNAMLSKTAGMTYLRYRTATLNAAKNLSPATCTNFNTVKAAWDAVSVPAQAADPTCTVGGGTVTVTNPGSQVRHGRHRDRAVHADRVAGRDVHLVGHRPAAGPDDRLRHRHRLRHARPRPARSP